LDIPAPIAPPQERIRLVDVAKQAGVSVTTASDALRGSTRVKRSTREKVRAVAKELRYKPNKVAQDLVRRSPSAATVIFSGPDSMNFLSNPIFIQLFRPVVETLNAKGIPVYTEIAASSHETERLEYHAWGGASGVIILIGSRLPDYELERLANEFPIPIVTVVRHPLPRSQVGVGVDNMDIGRQAAAHLLDLGHTRIGYIGATPGLALAEERLEGFRLECQQRGITLRDADIKPGDFYQESGRVAMSELIAHSEVTAVFAANDLMALGAIEACTAAGVRVPQDMSVLGCDDIPNLHLLNVPLSSIALPIQQLGVIAAEQAERVLNGAEQSTPTMLRANLVARASTGPAPGSKVTIK
jgi:LacI family transcriptional regulator